MKCFPVLSVHHRKTMSRQRPPKILTHENRHELGASAHGATGGAPVQRKPEQCAKPHLFSCVQCPIVLRCACTLLLRCFLIFDASPESMLSSCRCRNMIGRIFIAIKSPVGFSCDACCGDSTSLRRILNVGWSAKSVGCSLHRAEALPGVAACHWQGLKHCCQCLRSQGTLGSTADMAVRDPARATGLPSIADQQGNSVHDMSLINITAQSFPAL